MKGIFVGLYIVRMFFALSFMFCGATFADDALVKSMAEGTWTTNPRHITFGSYNGHALRWRVLEVYGDKTAFLVLDDVLRDKAEDGGGAVRMFFDDDSNSFPASEISKWLNDDDNDTDDSDGINGFINSAGLGAYKAGILDATYGPDDVYEDERDDLWAEATSKIFLLGANEAKNPQYFNANADRDVDEAYWLRSPGGIYGGTFDAAVVWPGGQVDGAGNNVDLNRFAVRPALKINLSSPVFTSALISYTRAISVFGIRQSQA